VALLKGSDHINANKATGKHMDPNVESEHEKYRDSAQAVDISPIMQTSPLWQLNAVSGRGRPFH